MKKNRSNRREIWQCHRFIAIGTRMRNEFTEALEDGCGVDAPGSFAAWLSRHTEEYAWIMPGKRYDIGDRKSYDEVCERFSLS